MQGDRHSLMIMKRIPSSSRSFCQAVAEFAFCNPFSDRWHELFSKILGPGRNDNDPGLNSKLFERAKHQLEQLGKGDSVDYRQFSGDDAETVRMMVIFVAFHALCDDLDAHITSQKRMGTSVARFKQGTEGMQFLVQSGFSEEEAVWFIAVFYQVRRAYHFITSLLIGNATCMKELKRRLWNNIFTNDIRHYEICMWDRMEDFSILLVGETGTGKGSAASVLGRSCFIPYLPEKQQFASGFQDAFIATNLSQYSPTLLESELFGHRKGAFTGALSDYDGLFARSSEFGAVFLDEIGDVSPHIQIKLLRLLQEREFSPVGGRTIQRFRGRVIAAAHDSIDQHIRDGAFRSDFYYRLCSDRVAIPTLRKRIEEDDEELPLMAGHLLERITGGASEDLLDWVMGALKPLKTYTWPGNVRELEQAIRQILLTSQYLPQDWSATTKGSAEKLVDAVKSGTMTAEDILHAYATHLYETHSNYETIAKQLKVDRRTVKKYLRH